MHLPIFIGSTDQKIDAKGRVSVPALFRKVVETQDPEFIPSTKGPGGDGKGNPATIYAALVELQVSFLECYTARGLEKIYAWIEGKGSRDPDRKLAEETYYENLHLITIDDDGRIVLPKELREKLALSDEVHFSARGDRFEIWNAETYRTHVVPEQQRRRAERGPQFTPRELFDNAKAP